MFLKFAFVGLVAAVLFGCSSVRAPSAGVGSSPGAPSSGVCNAQGAQFALGKVPVASLVEDARQRSGSYMARVLRPGQAVTMEFNAQRLNLDLDAAGGITRARCG